MEEHLEAFIRFWSSCSV